MKRILLCYLVIVVLAIPTLNFAGAQLPNASLTVTKTGVPLTQAAPGTITWNVTVENTGDVTLTGVNVTDSRHGPLGSVGVMAPGTLAFFTIVETDLTTGTYGDQAFAGGWYDPENLTVIAFSDFIECEVTPPNASLTVTKTGVPLTQAAPGTITWNVTVENTGDVTLTGVNVTDSRHGPLGSVGVMAPGTLAFFTIVETDLTNGKYTDQAFAGGWYDPENLTVIAFSDLIQCIVGPVIESSDSAGVRKDTFLVGEDVYVNGTGFGNYTLYSLYVVEDQVWSDNMTIPARVPGTATWVMSAPDGTIPPTLAWANPLVLGKYDIVVDVNNNTKYDVGVDALDDNDIEVTAGFFVIPEVPLGTLMASLAMIIGLACYVAIPKIRKRTTT